MANIHMPTCEPPRRLARQLDKDELASVSRKFLRDLAAIRRRHEAEQLGFEPVLADDGFLPPDLGGG